MTPTTDRTPRGVTYHSHAYWFAVGWNHAATGERCDPVDFAAYAADWADRYSLGETSYLPSIDAMFIEWTRLLPQSVREGMHRP